MIVIICDATKEIGYGHLKRCLVLASFYRQLGVSVTFLMRHDSKIIKGILSSEKMGLVVRSNHKKALSYLDKNKIQIKLVIIDHYEVGPDIEEKIFKMFPVLVIDDLCRRHWCNLLVDQTFKRDKCQYDKKLYYPLTRTLLGIEFTLIDPIYKTVRTNGDQSNILITFGATDPGNRALQLLEILENKMSKKDVVFHLPLSSLSPCLDEVKKFICQSKMDIRLYQDLSDLSLLYEKSGIAIGAPGTSLLERIYCGLINITVVVAQNQEEVGQKFSDQGMTLHFGGIHNLDFSKLIKTLEHLISSQSYRKELQKKTLGLVDGKGALRIIKKSIPLIDSIKLRSAKENDLKTLYQWQQNKGAREHFNNTAIPSKQEHQIWFGHVLSSKDIVLKIIEWNNKPIGYIRLNIQLKKNEVSILIIPEFQGFGFAKAGLKKLVDDNSQNYIAFVKPENKASIQLFKSAGFQPMGKGEYILNAVS